MKKSGFTTGTCNWQWICDRFSVADYQNLAERIQSQNKIKIPTLPFFPPIFAQLISLSIETRKASSPLELLLPKLRELVATPSNRDRSLPSLSAKPPSS